MAEYVVNINLGALAQGLEQAVYTVARDTLFSLRAADELSGVPTLFQRGPVRLTLASVGEENFKEEFRRRQLRLAISDCADNLSDFLREVRRVCAMGSLMRADGTPIDAEAFNVAVIEEDSPFERRYFPDKLTYLREKFPGFVLPSTEMIDGYNRMRNCLVHRRGIVDTKDTNSAEGLSISFIAIEVIATLPDGSVRDLTAGPEHLEAGTQVSAQERRRTRNFAVGEVIHVTHDELFHICHTYSIFARETALAVENWYRSKGIAIPSAAPAVTPSP